MIDIEIFSDVICPWCFIGKSRLDKVLTTELGDGVKLRWRPYQLYPATPLEGVDRIEMLRRRYGPDADTARLPQRIASEASEEGIELRYDLIQRTPNTLMAHRLLELAHETESESDQQHELAQALFVGYFCAGRDVGNLETLVEIAAEVGMDTAIVRDYLLGERGLAEVKLQLERAVDIGVSGVPGYYLGNAFLLPGAQTVDTMEQIIRRVQTRLMG